MNDQISRQKLIEELNNLSLDIELWTSMKPNEIVNATVQAYMKFVMETIESQPPADNWIPCSAAVDTGYLEDWYINSVTGGEPVWTEAHIEELCDDFIIIPKSLPEPYKGVE